MAIDINLGSDPNSINLGSKGKIPVGVLSGTYEDIELNTDDIDWSTVVFAGAFTIGQSPEDLDSDLDQVFHFNRQETDLTADSTEGCLTGQTTGGIYFEEIVSGEHDPPADNPSQDKKKGGQK